MTAGTLFESVPFVLAVSVFPGRLVRSAAALVGCGCGSAAGPGALSLPAAALCWAIFGPWVAAARFGAALVLQWRDSRRDARERGEASASRCGHERAAADPLADLWSIAAPAFALAVATSLLRGASLPGWSRGHPVLLGIAEFGAGLAGGAFSPCVTSAVALAGMLRGDAPAAAAGLLVSAGLVPRLRSAGGGMARGRFAVRDARFGLALVAIACAGLAMRGGSGFVHPRLLPLEWLAPAAAIAVLARQARTGARFAAVAPAAMLAALVLGSPLPAGTAGGSTLDGLYPGEAVVFSGAASSRRGGVTLVRYAITCCRADATAVLVPTDLVLRVPPETWLAVRGVVANGTEGVYLRVSSWRRIARPSDPFLYR